MANNDNFGESTYLKQLKFDPRLKVSFIAKYLGRIRLSVLILVTIVFLGIASYLQLPRNLTPEIKIPLVIVSAVLPGAGPNDIESLVTIPIEDAVRTVQKIQKVQSTSRDSVSITQIQFENGVDPDKARSDIQAAVDSITDFPGDIQAPKVQKLDFENQPVWTFNLVGSADSASLFRFANILKNNLENVPNVDKVVISGSEDQEIQLLIKPEVIATYNINPMQITGLIKSSIKSLPAGSVITDNSTFSLTIDPAAVSVDDIRNLKINLNGTTLSLGDIVVISDRSKPSQAASYVVTKDTPPNRTVTFDVFKTSGAKIEEAVKAAKKEVDSQIEPYHGEFKVFSVNDTGDRIDKLFNRLQRDFLNTIILVTVILFIFLGIRQSVVSSLTAPIVFFITFLVMNLLGISLSFIAIFSLLLALGLLVDDTIVIISATTAYYRTGKFTPLETGLLVWRDFLLPVLTTTTTTVFAFLPLLISGGIIGEFIKPVPIVVSTTLIASIFTALFITFPAILYLLAPRIPERVSVLLKLSAVFLVVAAFYILVPKDSFTLLEVLAFLIFLFVSFQVRHILYRRFLKATNIKNYAFISSGKLRQYLGKGLISFSVISGAYKRLITRILRSPSIRKKTVIMVIVFSVFSFLLLPLGLVKNEFFPKTDQNVLYITVELPPGTSLEIANKEALNLLNQLKTTPETLFITANVGKTLSGFGGAAQGTTNNILFSIDLIDSESRKTPSSDIANIIRKRFAGYQKGRLLVQEVSGGPPVGADVQIKYFGSDLRILDEYANKTQDYLSKQVGFTNIDKSIKAGTGKIVFVPDKEKLANFGLTQDAVGFWLRLYASGFTADKIKLEGEGSDKQEINIRLSPQAQFVENISSLSIPTPMGNIPISDLGTLKLEPNPTLITREDYKRTISVTSAVSKGFSIPAQNAKLGKFADTLRLPTDYSWKTGGANEENQKSINTMLEAMFISFLLIIVTMVIQFNSFRRATVVMLVIPLSIAGVFIIFALTQIPLTFPALIGVLALFGIVVKNSILIVDKIVANQKVGMNFIESISDASSSRLEAIALTSLTAIFGLIPITLSDALWRGLGGAIIAGLTFSGTIMLLFIPVVYFYLFEKESQKKNYRFRD